jgi:membrane protein DedA with SNARE-associated domain
MELFSLSTLEAWAHQFGYGLIFGGIMLENAGIPLPGETIVLLGGFLAGNGELDIKIVFASATAGAVLGDNCGYWLGRWGGMNLLRRLSHWFHIPETEILRAQDKFRHNADRAVFLGRFITFLRIFAGPLAGMAGMAYPRFLWWNVAGAVTWAVVMLGLSYGTGKFIPLSQLVHYTLQFGLAALLAVSLWVALPWLKNYLPHAVRNSEK